MRMRGYCSLVYKLSRLDAGIVDAGEDSRDISVHLMVRDAQDAKSVSTEDRVTLSISLALLVMNRAVYFDDKASGVAIGINYETMKHMLAPKVEARVVMVAQVLPEDVFLRRHISAKGTSPLRFNWSSMWRSRPHDKLDCLYP